MSYSPPILAAERQTISVETSLPNELLALATVSPASAAWPVANLAIFVPIYLAAGAVIRQIWWLNGSTITGATSVEAALYDELGLTKLLSSGVITHAGASAIQATVLGSPVYLPRGRYWLGLVCGNNTSTFVRHTNSANVTQMQKIIGTSEQALGSTALPAAITFGAAAQAYIPLMGLSQSALTL